MNGDISLKKVSFAFKEICNVAKIIKPDCWCIAVSDQRLAFIEISLPQNGPASLLKQLILNNYLQLEAYVGHHRVSEKVLNTNQVTSVTDLAECLNAFARFGSCLGNRNFHRTTKTSHEAKMEFWRHTNCLLLYEKGSSRKEQCCDACLSLNTFLTKKQRENVIPYCGDFPDIKKFKAVIVKSEVV